jgi:hypothetical protein
MTAQEEDQAWSPSMTALSMHGGAQQKPSHQQKMAMLRQRHQDTDHQLAVLDREFEERQQRLERMKTKRIRQGMQDGGRPMSGKHAAQSGTARLGAMRAGLKHRPIASTVGVDRSKQDPARLVRQLERRVQSIVKGPFFLVEKVQFDNHGMRSMLLKGSPPRSCPPRSPPRRPRSAPSAGRGGVGRARGRGGGRPGSAATRVPPRRRRRQPPQPQRPRPQSAAT